MKDYIVECCPECESEIELRWDISRDGYKAFCPVCGARLMLCDACQHRLDDNQMCDCDYDSVTDSCRFNRDRISMIKAKRKDINDKEARRVEAENIERSQLISQVFARQHRIFAVLETTQALVDNGFELPYHHTGERAALADYGYNHGVLADGVYHGVGIWHNSKSAPIEWLAIRNGGACGDYHFYTNGISIRFESDGGKSNTIPIAILKKFLKEFDAFELAFYAWVDDQMKI